MSSGDVVSLLTVDANVLVSALRRGAAVRVLACPRLTFLTTVHTTWEVERYIPSRGALVTEAELGEDLRALPIVAVPDAFYRTHFPRARALMEQRDPRDVDILALTLRLAVPLWTNDRDFEGIPEIQVVTTAGLLAVVEG